MPAILRITEVGSSMVGVDWFEVTNYGAVGTSLTNYRMGNTTHNTFAAGTVLINISGIAPNEKVIYLVSSADADQTTFKSQWTIGPHNLSTVQVGRTTTSVGYDIAASGDQVFLWDNTGTLVQSIAVPTATSNKTWRWGYNSSGTLTSGPALSFVGDSDAAYASNPGEIGSPAAAGEPHFVGLDGVHFDYHGVPGNQYLLWQDQYIKVIALFDLEPAAAKYPNFGGTTFMTKIWIKTKDIEITFGPDDFNNLKEAQHADQSTGLVRGMPKTLQGVEGDVTGAKIINYPNGQVVLSAMHFQHEFDFLNVSFIIKSKIEATGIIGQTSLPPQIRLPNDCFRLGNTPIYVQKMI